MYYYDIDEDIKNYPDCWVYIIIGGRNTGKTYSSLKSCYLNERNFVFTKRTIEDVNLLCAGGGKIGTKQNEFGVDLSPFKSINRDLGSNVKAFSIFKGLGGFWNYNEEENEPIGQPIGYITSLSAINKVKGFDLSECDWLIFDEFIPQPWERISHKEGEQVMDLYKTISRDREHRGKEPLKLICLANATNVFNPTMEILEITDNIVEMEKNDDSILYIEERGILIHRINDNDEFKEIEKQSKIYQAMSDTSWGQMALNNTFAYDDFSSVGKLSLKGFQPYIRIKYKKKYWYVYQKNGLYYCCTSSTKNYIRDYNLNLENDQKLFYNNEYFKLKSVCIKGHMKFQNYTMYRIIIRFKDIFKI